MMIKIIGVEVNNQILIVPEDANSTDSFKAFMSYCIENYIVRINQSDTFEKKVKIRSDDPGFKRSIFYKRIVEHNGYYYSTYIRSDQKRRIMERISDELGIELNLTVVEV
jgi:hypothetical protein